MASEIIGGIEGGASNSTCVLMNPQGQIIAVAKGTATNHYLLGMEKCREKIAALINDAKTKAGISLDVPLAAVGLSLSGCEQEDSNQELVRGLIAAYPKLALQYSVGSDTLGSIATISKNGGVVCISGTGSNTLLINPDGRKYQCGGWGYLLGDEGSAWSISHRALKYVIDVHDGFKPAPYPTDQIWELAKKFFNLHEPLNILDIFYTNFDKSRISSLCKSLADLARSGDKLSRFIFEEAGADVAKMIVSVHKKAAKELLEGGLRVICVGSVWLSWDLLKCGFNNYIYQHNIEKLTLLRLTTEMGVGAALMVSDKLNLKLERDYSKNYKVFAVYNRKETCNGAGH